MEVPEFAIYHDRKSFGTAEKQTHATVIFVQCKERDAGNLKQLLGSGKSDKRAPYIPAGYHLSTSLQRLLQVLNAQNEYVNSRRVVPIIGISKDKIKQEVSLCGETKTVREHICQHLRVKYVEKTNRTGNIGK